MDAARRRRRRLLLQHDAFRRLESRTAWKTVLSASDYNIADFSLSRTLRSCSTYPSLHLSPSHLQLAAQVPSQWTRSEQTLKQARLALRKIVWRALLQDAFKMRQELVEEGGPGTSAERSNSMDPSTRAERIGRLNDAAYADWGTFCNVVRAKLHLQHRNLSTMPPLCSERRVAVFHVLRCILGPVVESFILLDRLAWMLEELDVRKSYFCHMRIMNSLRSRDQCSLPIWSTCLIKEVVAAGTLRL